MLIGALIGGVVFFLLGFILYGFVLGDMMASHSNMSCQRSPGDENYGLLVVANLLWGFTFAYVFIKSNVVGAGAGARMGATLAVLIGLTIDLFLLATTTMYADWTVTGLDVVINIISGAIGGAAIGWWLGRK